MERRNQKLMEEYNKSLLAWDTRPPLAAPASSEGTEEIRRGPWTVDEDLLLINYVAQHGQGRWNALARSAGLKRTGKSCRFRWLNYLRPGVRRGNITLEEQLLILELHSRWGNRWSKIARFLPGRTDNEIKNYWRTRVQKHAKQLRCDDAGSRAFMDGMRRLWMQAASSAAASTSAGLLVYPCTPTIMTGTTMVNSGSSSEEYYFSPPPPPPQQLSSLGSNVIGLEEEIAGGIDALLGGGGEWTERHVDFPGNTYVGGDWPWSIDCLWSDMQII